MVLVLLPPSASHLAPLVREADCTPVIDATGQRLPDVPDGAWVRTRPGRPAPGNGPVILAEFGAAVPSRPTWLETAEPRDIPTGFAGLVLKGREAGGMCGAADGLTLLALCPDKKRVILDAGLGPQTAAAALAMGAGGVLLVEQHLGCPEFALPAPMLRRLQVPDDEISAVVNGLRVANPTVSPVLRRLLQGEDPWALADGLWNRGDLREHLWMAGQGLALAQNLADRHGTLEALLQAYVRASHRWPKRVQSARALPDGRPVGTASALGTSGAAATSGGAVGSGVLWQEAVWMARPVMGGPLEGAIALGTAVIAEEEPFAAAKAALLGQAPDVPDEPTSEVPRPEPKEAARLDVKELSPRPTVDEVRAIPSQSGAVAIVGIGLRFPGANSTDEFWRKLLEGYDAITDVPRERWEPEHYYDADASVPDKTYAKIGGFLTDFVFDSKRFRIPPRVAKQIDPVQQVALMAVADALTDAGLQIDSKSGGRPFDRGRCAVILGNAQGGEVREEYAKRIAWSEVKKKLSDALDGRMSGPKRDEVIEQFGKAYLERLPDIDEDSMPGELSNVIAGRIANAFDLTGVNFTADAACASTMAALQSAVKGLQDHDFDIAISGGADRSMNASTFVKFSKIGALSGDHSAPFDASANGFVMGEGCGILVLKRYEDAVRDKDKIYAVVRGIGASSDGKGKGITAPNPNGQKLALERAYKAAGIDPATVDLVEAHGTSTPVGDKVEVEALSDFIGEGKRGGKAIRIGSVKSNIGHLKAAAGAASLIKAALAIYHGVFPPSINYKVPRADLDLSKVPLKVQTKAETWKTDGPRRAGVSSFGFGGVNYHVVLESASGQALPTSTAQPPVFLPNPPVKEPIAVYERPPEPVAPVAAAPQPRIEVEERPLPDGLWAISGRDSSELVRRIEAVQRGGAPEWDPSEPLRLAAAAATVEERADQLERAAKIIGKGGNPDMLRARAIHLEDGVVEGRVCMLFTGQGSQYLDMGLDLAEAYPVVKDTFAEADAISRDAIGAPISSFIRSTTEAETEQREDKLRQTEISQPATLTVDVAILRLLAAYGIQPDMVAGHSLGEYAAAVAAGMFTFEQALRAVTARGREMAAIRIDDPGKMAGIAASSDVVEEVLADVQGYVIAANKNCPTQTVIAGASDAVDEACERFRARGITVHMLAVSHAFHSRIVAPASKPLENVLKELGVKPPRRPITTNVTADYYPSGPGSEAEIISLLSQQISAPVEWTAQIERMYADGARIFVECGPKRALSGFVVSILKRRPHRALYTNHPKRGGVWSFRDALAGMLVTGRTVRAKPGIPELFADVPAPPVPAPTARAEALPDIEKTVLGIVAKSTGYSTEELDLDFELEADLGVDTVKQAEVFAAVRSTYGIPADVSFSFAEHRKLRSVIDWVAHTVGATRTPQAAPAPAPAPAPAAAPVAVSTDGEMARFLQDAAKAGLGDVDADAFASQVMPAMQRLLSVAFEAAKAARKPEPAPVPPPVVVRSPTPAPVLVTSHPPAQGEVRVVCSGAALGLPGGERVFSDDNVSRILAGENRIAPLGEKAKTFLDYGIIRLHKDAKTGEGSFAPVQSVDEVIRLAGRKAAFDPADWDLPRELVEVLDITSQLAIVAGIEALRDAGIPLVQNFRGTERKRVSAGWRLPEGLRDRTGVVFGSAFPGYDQLLKKIEDHRAGEPFDRRFLFQVLAFGHAQIAQLLGIRGPNTQINAACASTTQAVAIAADWIRLGRADRVLVLGADDVTSDQLLPWIGSGFLASGAATTEDEVSRAALPFDRRRHGMILGMGAVGLVLERDDLAAARGTIPVAELVGDVIANSAFHGSRLDTGHIAGAMEALIRDVERRDGVSRSRIASSALFMSHETYTPARGGSAAAEIEALRGTFGADASQITIANTKGFTGHPMGAGVEDAVAVKALQYGRIPPVANFREPDEALGDLRISRGEAREVDYAIRLAAGFGSQLALTVWKRRAKGDHRVSDPALRQQWLRELTGYAHVQEVVDHRTLKVIPSDQPYPAPPPAPAPAPAPAPERPAARQSPPPSIPSAAPTNGASISVPVSRPDRAANAVSGAGAGAGLDEEQVLQELVALVAERTGYEPSEIEPDYHLEADLGIDTVKQAELFSELRTRHGLPRNDAFRLADYPTVRALAGYVAVHAGAPAAAVVEARPSGIPDVVDLDAARAAEEEFSYANVETSRIPTDEFGASGPGVLEDEAADAPSDTVESSAFAGSVAPGAMLTELTALIAEKTGYSPDELDSELELEADLGIDTVKQAEIFSEMRKRHGIAQDESFRLADHPTLEALATWLASRTGAANIEDAPRARVAETDVSEELTPAIPDVHIPETQATDEVQWDEIPLPSPEDDDEKTSPTQPILPWEAASSQSSGPATLVPDSGPEVPLVVHRNVSSTPAPQPERTDRRPSDPIVYEEFDLAPSVSEEAPLELPPSFRIRRPVLVERRIPSGGGLQGRKIRVLGDGRRAQTIRREIVLRGGVVDPDVADTVVDAGEEVVPSFEAARALAGRHPASWLCVTHFGDLDGMYPLDRAFNDGARSGFCKALGREWTDTSARVLGVASTATEDEVGRAVCDELASGSTAVEVFRRNDDRRVIAYRTEPFPAKGRLSSVPVVVVTGGGRGISARVALDLAQRGKVRLILVGRSPAGTTPLDVDAEKLRIRKELQAAGERATPIEVERRMTSLRSGEEIRSNVEAMRAAGAEVHYWTADLADDDAVTALMRRVEDEFGTPDVVIHGAGVEESRKIEDKDLGAFERVFRGKARGGLAIVRAIPPATTFVSMGSVAGRFGNAGQVDYAAANDALARLCLLRPRSLHIAWTAWDDVGMAVRGGMRTLLSDRGVDLLPAGPGAALCNDLWLTGVTGEVVVAGGLGDFAPPPDHPLLDTLQLDGDTVRVTRRLDTGRDGWIKDHAIEGTPVLPGVIGLELMVAAATLAIPGLGYAGASDIRFVAPMKLYRDEAITATVEATPIDDHRVRCTLSSSRKLKTGREQKIDHFAATIELGASPEPEPLPSAFLPDELIDSEAIYTRFFHGPSFRVLQQVQGVAADGLFAEGSMEPAAIAEDLLSEPLVLEAAFQAAGLHRMILADEMALPASVDQVRLYKHVPPGTVVTLAVRVVHDAYDVDVDGPSGPLMRVRGFRMSTKGPLPPEQRFPHPDGGRFEVFPPPEPAGAADVGRGFASVEEDPSPWMRDDEIIRLSARGTDRRVKDRIAGRIAAKRALQQLGIAPDRVWVDNLPSGEPIVRDRSGQIVPVAVSLSHRDGRAAAIAVRKGRIGLDLESVEERPASFLETWFDGEERRSLPDERSVTIAWATKEAVLKALGSGLELDPRQIAVSVGDHRADVALRGEVAARHQSLGGGTLALSWEELGDQVIVIARFAA